MVKIILLENDVLFDSPPRHTSMSKRDELFEAKRQFGIKSDSSSIDEEHEGHGRDSDQEIHISFGSTGTVLSDEVSIYMSHDPQ